ncbi:MAG: protein-L-isoaspartate O-methyltransferase family protein [Geminicoccaceae bacterium]
MTNIDLDILRRCYAEELRCTAPILRNDAVAQAFATVPREQFLPSGPWRIIPPWRKAYTTPDADPRWLYHNVLVAIDEARDLNNGEPRFWAYLLDQLDVRPGDTVLHVGAGTGYYSAIFQEISGRDGRVVAIEYDEELAATAKRNLEDRHRIEVIQGDGTAYVPGPVDVIIVNAGVTHPAPSWLDALKPGGRLLLPLTAEDRSGFYFRIERCEDGYAARAISRVGIFHCGGSGRDAALAARLQHLVRRGRGKFPPVRSLHRGAPPKGRSVWYHGPDFWLSKKPLASSMH